MRTRLKNYRIEANYQGISNCIVLDSDVITSVEDIRLIVNETQRIVIASSMKKSGVSTDGLKSITPILNGESVQVGTVLEINTAVCTLVASPQPDKLTIEIDKGTDIGNLEKAAQESTPFAIEQSIGDLPASGKTVHTKIDDVSVTIGTGSTGHPSTLFGALEGIEGSVGKNTESDSSVGSLHQKESYVITKLGTPVKPTFSEDLREIDACVKVVVGDASVIKAEVGSHTAEDASLDTVHKKLTEVLAREGDYTDASHTTIQAKVDKVISDIGTVETLLGIINGEMQMTDSDLRQYYQEHWNEINS